MSRRLVPNTDPVWRALGDPTRRQILDLLRRGPMTTGALAARFPTTRFTVMGHLDVLLEASLVTVERRGRERLNHLNPVPLRRLYERWVTPLAGSSAAALLRLAEEADRPPIKEEPVPTPSVPLGLDTRAQHVIRAEPRAAWSALLRLAQWWPPCWEDDERLLFEPWAGGRIGVSTTEGFGTDASLWGVVTSCREGRELTVGGAMGIGGPVVGEWRIRLEPDSGGRTLATVEHRMLGAIEEQTAGTFTRRWPQVLRALASDAERD